MQLPFIWSISCNIKHRVQQQSQQKQQWLKLPNRTFHHLLQANVAKLKCSIRRRHQANEGKSGLEAERVRALGALRSFGCKENLAAEKQREMHSVSNAENETWIEDYVERATTVARKQVKDTATVIKQDEEHMRKAYNAGLTTREPEKMCQEVLNDIKDSLSDLASSDYEEDAEYQDD